MLYAVTRKTLLLAALVAFATSTAFARDDIRTERVHFKPGASSATVKGKIKGYETVDYVLEASKGQQLNVSMSTDNLSSYFNILSPGENEVAMFIGSTSGNQYEGTLPKSGPYKIRVYMMRNAPRRDEVANYSSRMGTRLVLIQVKRTQANFRRKRKMTSASCAESWSAQVRYSRTADYIRERRGSNRLS
jgi:hypothetical protein